jgi:hypothetical protein
LVLGIGKVGACFVQFDARKSSIGNQALYALHVGFRTFHFRAGNCASGRRTSQHCRLLAIDNGRRQEVYRTGEK